MKLNCKISAGFKNNIEEELLLSELEFNNKEFQRAWRHLERAHILGQTWP